MLISNNIYTKSLYYNDSALTECSADSQLSVSNNRQCAVCKYQSRIKNKDVNYSIFYKENTPIKLQKLRNPSLFVKLRHQPMNNHQLFDSDVFIPSDNFIILVIPKDTHILCQYMDVKGVIYDYQIIHIRARQIYKASYEVQNDSPTLLLTMKDCGYRRFIIINRILEETLFYP